MDAVMVCVDRGGLHSFALEDVAVEANLSRATIYRHFPGGRTQLINDTVTREVARFWGELADHVRPLADIEDRLVVGLMEARRRIDEYDLLQRLVASEPDDLLPALSVSDQLVQIAIVGYIKDLISREELVEGLDLDTAAEYLTRMLLSHIGTAGRWDLTDRTQVERLVRTQFLAGINPRGGVTSGTRATMRRFRAYCLIHAAGRRRRKHSR